MKTISRRSQSLIIRILGLIAIVAAPLAFGGQDLKAVRVETGRASTGAWTIPPGRRRR